MRTINGLVRSFTPPPALFLAALALIGASGAIQAMRVPFLTATGLLLILISWRMARNGGTWGARLMVAGGLLLGFGYAILLPMYEVGVITKVNTFTHARIISADAIAWHAVKLVVMNCGWLLFGIGTALQVKLFNIPAASSINNPQPITPNEFVA